MPDPMGHIGEDVPPQMNLSPEAMLILGLIRDTMLSPRPIGREQAALSILTALVHASFHGRTPNEMNTLIPHCGGTLVNLSIEMADSLLLRLDNPDLGPKA